MKTHSRNASRCEQAWQAIRHFLSSILNLKLLLLLAIPALLASLNSPLLASPLGTAFTYQGRLTDGAGPANGQYELQFSLHDAAINGNLVGLPVNLAPVTVSNGLFQVSLDFGANAFTGAERWLEITVTVFGSDMVPIRLSPRQPVTAAPYALQALTLAPPPGATGPYATIGGGASNGSSGDYATVGGGGFNNARGFASTVGGGGGYVDEAEGNSAAGDWSTVSGGKANWTSAHFGVVGGGELNSAEGRYAVVPGGMANRAQGEFSFAAGENTHAVHDGTFVWADASFGGILRSTTNNQFTVRASGGVRFFSNAGATTGVEMAAGGNAWSVVSDRYAKENFAPLDCREVLAKLNALSVTSWNLKSQPAGVRHVGPMAQDFHAAFGVGEDDRHISTSDADGVALAAIKGLNQKLEEQLHRRDAENAELKQRLARLEQLVHQLTAAKNESGSFPVRPAR